MPSIKIFTRPQPQEHRMVEGSADLACVLSATTPANTVQLQTRDYSAGVGSNTLANWTVDSEGELLADLRAAVIATIASDVVVYLFASNDGGATKRLVATATIKAQTINATTAPVPAKFYDASGNLYCSIDDPARLAAGVQLFIGVGSATAVVVTGEALTFKRYAG